MKPWKTQAIKRITATDFIPRRNKDVVAKLLRIFKNHIGEENKLSANQLFKKVYKVTIDDVTDLQRFLLLNQITIALAYMRQNSNCFIVRNGSFLWVAKSQDDYRLFSRHTQAQIKGMLAMEKRCENAVSQRWWMQDFRITKQLKAPEQPLHYLDVDDGAAL